jgi:hypothetical protein
MSDLLRVELDLMVERAAVGRLLRKYADRPRASSNFFVILYSPNEKRLRFGDRRDRHHRLVGGHAVVAQKPEAPLRQRSGARQPAALRRPHADGDSP